MQCQKADWGNHKNQCDDPAMFKYLTRFLRLKLERYVMLVAVMIRRYSSEMMVEDRGLVVRFDWHVLDCFVPGKYYVVIQVQLPIIYIGTKYHNWPERRCCVDCRNRVSKWLSCMKKQSVWPSNGVSLQIIWEANPHKEVEQAALAANFYPNTMLYGVGTEQSLRILIKVNGSNILKNIEAYDEVVDFGIKPIIFPKQ